MLIVGSGGREHALAWRLARDGGPSCTPHPGIPGSPRSATCHPVRADDGDGLLELAHALEVDLAVIGPEAPLVAGVGDRLRHGGFPVFGPSAAAARIEGSKSFAKEVLEAAGVPTARALVRSGAALRGQGRRARRRQGRLRLPDAGGARRRPRGRARARWPRRRRGAARGRRAVGVRALRRAASASRSPRPATTSASATATPARTPAAWAPSRRFRGSTRPRSRSSSTSIHAPVVEELARRGGTVHRRALRRADADRRRARRCSSSTAGSATRRRSRSCPRIDGDLLGCARRRPRPATWQASISRSTPRAAVTVVVAGGEYPERNDTGSEIDGDRGGRAARRARLPQRDRAARRARSSRTAAESSA